MAQTKFQLDGFFEKFARVLYLHKLKSLLSIIAFTLIFAWHLPNLVIDTSTIGFLSEKHPDRVFYTRFLEQYGRDDVVLIAIESENIFSLNTLNKIREMQEKLKENVPHLSEIESIINARHTYGENDSLTVDELMKEWPETEEDLTRIKNLALSNSNYTNFLISEDAKFATLIVKLEKTLQSDTDYLLDDFAEIENIQTDEEYSFLSGAEETEALKAINKVIINFSDANTKISVSGSPVVLDAIKSTLMEDMPIFMGSAILIITFVLYILFRRISAVAIPISVVIFSMLSTFGLMAWANVPFTVATQILPSFLIAVAVGSSVHLLVIFYRHYDQNLQKLNAIAYAANHSGTPIVMTTFTTAIGFMSFIFAKVEPVADLGWVSACGIMFVLLYSITLVPIMISFLNIKTLKPAETENKDGESFADKVLNSMADVSIKHPAQVLSFSFILIAVSLYGGTRVGVSYNPLNWFPEDSVVRINTEHLNEKLRGINTFEIVFDTGVENGVYNPEFLNGLESATAQILPLQVDNVFIGKVHSIANVIKEINQALNNNDPKFYTIPQNRDLVAQQFFLFENTGSEDLETIVDSQFRETRMTVKVPWENASKYVLLIPQIEQILNNTFPDSIKFRITGIGALYGAVLQEITASTLESYALALTVITILMVVFLGGLRVGLASMIPNISPILITVGIMGYSGITLNIFTMLVGSIAIGLAVDDTIHFMHNYKRYYFRYHGDSARAVRETLLSSGRAMAVTTLVLTTGFFVFMNSSMSNLFEFGLITGISIFMALLADFFLAPAIVILFSKHIYSPINGWIDEPTSRPVRATNNTDRRTLSGINYAGRNRRTNHCDRRDNTMVPA